MLPINALRMRNPAASGPTEPAWSGAPGYIGSGTFTAVAGDVSFDVPYPASIMYHDILILTVICLEVTTGSPTVTDPAGWTLIDKGTINGNSLRTFSKYWKRADGTETGSVNITAASANSSGDAKSGIISIYRGCVATGTPYEGLATTNGASTTPTGSAVTTTGADRKVVNLICKVYPNADTNITPAAGWTEQFEVSATLPKISAHVIHDKTVASASTEPAEVASNASVQWSVTSLALLPR